MKLFMMELFSGRECIKGSEFEKSGRERREAAWGYPCKVWNIQVDNIFHILESISQEM